MCQGNSLLAVQFLSSRHCSKHQHSVACCTCPHVICLNVPHSCINGSAFYGAIILKRRVRLICAGLRTVGVSPEDWDLKVK